MKARGTGDQRHESASDIAERLAAGRADLVAQAVQKDPLQLRPEAKQARIPLPVGFGTGEPPVVQLVTAVQRQLQIVVRQRVNPGHRRCRAQRTRALSECRKDDGAERTTRRWQPRSGRLGLAVASFASA